MAMASEGHPQGVDRVPRGFMKRPASFAKRKTNTREDQGQERT